MCPRVSTWDVSRDPDSYPALAAFYYTQIGNCRSCAWVEVCKKVDFIAGTMSSKTTLLFRLCLEVCIRESSDWPVLT